MGYYSYLHSVVVDRDLDLGDEYRAAEAAGVTVNPEHLSTVTATGRLADFFPVGPALLASPLYVAALALHPDGRPVFGSPFTTAFDLASLAYGLLALGLAFRLAASSVPAWAAATGAAAVGLATSLTYYLVYQPSYSHTFSAFAVSLFVLAWWTTRGRRGWHGWLLLGLLGGLMACVRFQDGPLLAIVLLDVPSAGWRTLLALPGALAGFAPQLAVDRLLFGTWLPQRPAGQDLQWFPGHYLDVLFSSYHGLFVWAPALVAAAAGLVLLRQPVLQVAAAYAFAVEVAINGAAPDWWGGYAFGARRFIDLAPFFALGLGEVARRVGPRLAVAATLLLAAWNALLVANLTYIQRSDHDPGYLGLLRGQAQALAHLPNLLAQGAAGRDLLWWPVLHRPFEPVAGLALLICEAAAVALALAIALPGADRLRGGHER